MYSRLNQFRVMWLFVFFDMPTETKRDRKAHTIFRKRLLQNGFAMFQYSIYLRHCASRENAEVHKKRVENILPDKGNICILSVTDHQFGNILLFHGKEVTDMPETPQQMELF